MEHGLSESGKQLMEFSQITSRGIRLAEIYRTKIRNAVCEEIQ